MLKERVESLETQNKYNETKFLEYESKYRIISELYENSKSEFHETYSKMQDVSKNWTNSELLSEHRLVKIKDLEREVHLKEDKILEFRTRFDMVTQKLLNKDEILQGLKVEKDKIEAQFQEFKEAMIQEGKFSTISEESNKGKLKERKKNWASKREKEEKSFIDANDYALVWKKLKEVKCEHELIIEELKGYK